MVEKFFIGRVFSVTSLPEMKMKKSEFLVGKVGPVLSEDGGHP